MTSESRTVECKNCEARYKVPATFSSHKITCKRCQNPIFLRSPTTKKRRMTTRRYTRVKGNPKPKKITPVMYASGVACVALVAGILIFILI